MLLLLVVLTLSRILLVTWYWGRVEPTGGAWFIFLQGLRFDIALLGLLLGPALLAAPWVSGRKTAVLLLRCYLATMVFLIVYLELGTIPFIDQYDTRPNYLYVEYLKYPAEILPMLMASYGPFLVSETLLALVLAWLAWRLSGGTVTASSKVRLSSALLLTPIIALLIVMMARSTLDHRPINPSTVAFSTDSMVNQLPMNSPYTLLYAVYEQHRDTRKGEAYYGAMDDGEVLETVVQDAGLSARVDLQSESPTMHMQLATRQVARPLNLVIILQESLGAEFVGSLGGKDLTPNLDALANEGIWFEQLYATGTRSARGIEAIISGFPPTSKRSTVKLAETQDDFFTFAGLLKNQGYQTSFIYGGEAHFDNMRRFFLNNGFQTVIDEKDYENPQFLGAWGVSDEDLYLRAHEQFSEKDGQPFFSLVFTSSNHKPFDIPEGKVRAISGPDGGRDTAVHYADYALGKYFELARLSSYYQNTVFLVVSDHNSRVYGDQLVPIERFHIPGVILGNSIEPRRIAGISSQIDLFPTLLSLIGVNGRHPAIGYDLTTPEYFNGAGRAQMQFNDVQAWMVPGKVVILQHDLPMQIFSYQPGGKLVPDPQANRELKHQALAHALFAPMMIRNKAYRP
jgi:phosphoglycerol transferase MdoB-like AlkP superfamily enzyme